MAEEKKHQDKNWGGKRTGAGRPAEERPFSKQKKTHSLYCTSTELEYLKTILTRVREFRRMLDTEPCDDDAAHRAWDEQYQKVRRIDLQEVAENLGKD